MLYAIINYKHNMASLFMIKKTNQPIDDDYILLSPSHTRYCIMCSVTCASCCMFAHVPTHVHE